MKITDLLAVESIKLGGSATDKKDVLIQMVDLMAKSGKVNDKENYLAAVMAREEESTTGVGDGIAIPHGRCKGVSKPGLAAMTLPAGVDYAAMDDEPVNLIFLIAAPEGAGSVHIDILSKLSTMLMDDDFTEKLRAAKSVEEFRSIIDQTEAEKDAADAAKAAAAATANLAADAKAAGTDLIVAITACPTGIAHTYMAAEALEKAAKARGIILKAETQGSAGAKNILTADEIANAKGVIIAADKKVDLARFAGKQVLQTTVSAGINKPDELIDKIVSNQAPVLSGDASAAASAAGQEKDSAAHTFYKNLMNGVSHMLPFVVGGGILTALAFLLDMANAGQGFYGSGSFLAYTFKLIGETTFGFMLPIFAGFIAMSIADRPGLAVGFVGGAIANAGYTFSYISGVVAVNQGLADSAPGLTSGGFLGAMFAGFVGGYMMLGLEKLCEKLPAALEGIKPVLIYPLLGCFLIGIIMFTVNPIFGAINTGIANVLENMGTANLVLLGALVGGMMSTDMGGPINKAAYVFGTAMLAQGTESGQIIMAAVMVGGMVPPIVIALSTTFFKNRWTKQDRSGGLVNYIMGLSFISEGAIPYAAADPLRVIPSCIIGSAIAGAMSAAFHCTSPAPHGGFWVIAVIGNPLMYFVALLVGSVVGCLILSFLKKPIQEEA
jgi:PTS system fructose-specific IIC component